jgi:hypothetical protein
MGVRRAACSTKSPPPTAGGTTSDDGVGLGEGGVPGQGEEQSGAGGGLVEYGPEKVAQLTEPVAHGWGVDAQFGGAGGMVTQVGQPAPQRLGQPVAISMRWRTERGGAVALCEAGAGEIVDPGWSDRQGQLIEGGRHP